MWIKKAVSGIRPALPVPAVRRPVESEVEGSFSNGREPAHLSPLGGFRKIGYVPIKRNSLLLARQLDAVRDLCQSDLLVLAENWLGHIAP